MGIDALRNMSDRLGSSQGATREFMDLVPGNRLENFEELRNVRLEHDGPYLRIKRRGGTTIQRTVFGSVLTMYPFSGRINNVLKDFLAIHNTSGDIILWNITDDSTVTAMTGFPTGEQIQMAHSGLFLYAFSYDAGVCKYYDINAGNSHDFLNYDQSYVKSASFQSEPLTDGNLWDFQEGEQVLVYPNAAWDSGVSIYESSGNTEGFLDPSQYQVNSFRYVYNGGEYLTDSAGNDYQETRFFTFGPDDPPMSFTVGGSGDQFVIEMYYIPLDEGGDPDFRSYVARLTSVDERAIEWDDPAGVPASAAIGDPNVTNDYTDENIVLPYNPSMESMVGRRSNKKLSDGGDSVVEDTGYEAPVIHRGYLVLDILNDGSATIPGRPHQMDITVNDLYQEGYTKATLSISDPADNVAVRYLCATRWKPTPEDTFTPSQPGLENSPYFIIKEIDNNSLFVSDYTPDDQLLRPLEEQFDMSGGIADLFGTGQILPNSVTPFKGSLMFAGYQVSRPIPKPYTNPDTATDENIYVNITQTTQLDNDMALAFMFEYTDGKLSNIVETEEFLQEGSTTESEPIACDQVKAHASHTVTQGATADGEITVTYQGESVVINLTTANHSSPSEVAAEIRQSVNADSVIRISATNPSTDVIRYEEKRFGEEFNSNVVDIAVTGTDPGIAFDTEDPALADGAEPEGATAKGYITPVENNLSPGETNDLEFALDGVDSMSNPIEVTAGQNLQSIATDVQTLVNNVPGFSSDWSSYTEARPIDGKTRVVIESDYPGDTNWNDIHFIIQSIGAKIVFETDAPGKETHRSYQSFNRTGGAAEGCLQAEGYIEVSANNLGSGATEDHTITIDGNSTSPITIADTDTIEGIVDKYITEIESTFDIDLDVKTVKEDQGDGSWRVNLFWRQYGEVGNLKVVDVTGDTDVTVTTDNFSGGYDGGEVPVGSADEVNANRIQIHSLNGLVSKVYVLGRTINGSTQFHLIDTYGIRDPQTHGMIVELPNTGSEVDDIEASTFSVPASTDISEVVNFQNYLAIGTPFQQFRISDQTPIMDQSKILRGIPLKFDLDKTQMRYQFVIVTDRNLQMAYIVDSDQGFQKDIETFYEGFELKSREGAGRLGNLVVLHSEDGLEFVSGTDQPTKIVDNSEYSFLSNNLKSAFVNRSKTEYWFLFEGEEMLAYDFEDKAFRTFEYSGPQISDNIRHGVFAHGNVILAIGGDICYADLDGVHDDVGQGASDSHYIQGSLTTQHFGNANTQFKILEVDVGGQTYQLQVQLDLQRERLESDTGSWDKAFTADVSSAIEEADISGTSFQFHKRAIMPKMRILITGDGDGFISHVDMGYLQLPNKGKARV